MEKNSLSDFFVLVSDAPSRKGFDVYNIISKKYKYKTLIASDKDINRLSFVYFKKVYKLRTSDYKIFENDLLLIKSQISSDIVYIPVSEKVTILFYEFISKNSNKGFRFVLPNYKKFQISRNKIEFQKFCVENSINVPNSYKLNFLIKNNIFDKSLIVKPNIGAGSVGIISVKNREELLGLKSLEINKYLIQDKIKNPQVYGVFLLSNNGKLIKSFSHKRIRTFPSSGGVSVYSASELNYEIINISKSIVQKLEWSGLAMIEFMYDDETSSWKVIELNPRLWGSILLSPFSNVNLLKNYIEISLGKLNIQKSEKFRSTYIRWFFPYELISFISRKISFKDLINLNLKNTCYVNFTYSNIFTALTYQIYFIFNLSSIVRFIKKIR